MKYILDLKNTIALENGFIAESIIEALTELASNNGLMIYSICEDWTFKVLNSYSAFFELCEQIVLVNNKTKKDLLAFKNNPDILLIGDGTESEIKIANGLGIRALSLESPAELVGLINKDKDDYARV